MGDLQTYLKGTEEFWTELATALVSSRAHR
jgi:hypothetical protein